MKWHTDISIGDLHYLRSKFAESQGKKAIYLASFNKATEAFYHSKQFRVCGEHFITWAFLDYENEINYLMGELEWLDNMHKGNAWVVEANMHGMALSAMRELREICPKVIHFKHGYKDIRHMHVPDLTIKTLAAYNK